MPIYEYWCPQCCRRFAIYLPSYSTSPPPCPKCGKSILERRFSTFSVAKTSNDVYEGILNDTQLKRGMLSNDPRALAEWSRRMGGTEKVAPEYEEMVQRLEHGEMPPELSGAGTEKTQETPSQEE